MICDLSGMSFCLMLVTSTHLSFHCSKTALLEGLEIDQYVWGILQELKNTDFEDFTVDPTASWKPIGIKTEIKQEDGTGGILIIENTRS